MRATGLAIASTVLCFSVTSALDFIIYGAFTQTATYSIAQQLGFFAAANLSVTYSQIPNSTFAYPNLLSGGYDILTGTIDNAVNLRFNQNRSLTVLGQLDAGPDIVIAATPDITSIRDLKGKPIIVDSPISGYAYILRKVLSLYGLRLEDGDYFFQTAGSTNLRYEYLTNGALPNGTAVYATILTYPFTALAQAFVPESRRPVILARVSDFIEPLSSSALTISQASLDNPTRRDRILRFFAAIYAANKYLADTGNRNCAVRAIGAQLNISSSLAGAEYVAATNVFTGESGAGSANFNVSRQGLLNVIDVRQQFGGFSAVDGIGFDFVKAMEPGTGQLIDYTIRDEAIGSARLWSDGLLEKGSSLCH